MKCPAAMCLSSNLWESSNNEVHCKVRWPKFKTAPRASNTSRPSKQPNEGMGTSLIQTKNTWPPTHAGSRHLLVLMATPPLPNLNRSDSETW